MLDLTLYHDLNDYADHHAWFQDPSRFFATDGIFVLGALAVLLFLARGRWASAAWRRGVVSAAFSAVIALGIGYVISHVVDRARPFVHHRAFNLLHHSADAGFPSDHATAAFAIAAAIFIRSRRMGALALLIALLIAIGRVAEGAHYPSDVLGAAVLGCLVAIVLWLPPLRRVLDALADWAGKVYDRLAATVLRQPVRT